MMDSSKKQMNDYWHIPRASLAGSASSAASSASSSNRSNKSHSNPPTVAKRASTTHSRRQQHRDQQKMHFAVANNFPTINYGQQGAKAEDAEMAVGMAVADARKPKRMSNSNTPTRTPPTIRTTTAAAAAAAAAALAAAAATNKRGSRSSQGSSDSNNSTRSAASGSLLLTAANLERFAEIHKKQHQHNKLYMEGMPMPSVHRNQHNATTAYNGNLVQAISGGQQQQSANSSSTHESANNNDAVITMDPNLDFIKTKDLDTVSIASSMHFTMVNGEIGQTKKPKRGLCDRGRQVTVLIVSMSTIFLLLIMGMVYALEMRAREMPQS